MSIDYGSMQGFEFYEENENTPDIGEKFLAYIDGEWVLAYDGGDEIRTYGSDKRIFEFNYWLRISNTH